MPSVTLTLRVLCIMHYVLCIMYYVLCPVFTRPSLKKLNQLFCLVQRNIILSLLEFLNKETSVMSCPMTLTLKVPIEYSLLYSTSLDTDNVSNSIHGLISQSLQTFIEKRQGSFSLLFIPILTSNLNQC